MIYNREQVLDATLKYFNGDELAANVWIDKYCLKKGDEFYELTPDDMHRRLAGEFARIERRYASPISEEEIFELLKDFKYIVPQGSPMAGVGNHLVTTSLSNCFVIGKHIDSYGGILRADEEQAQLMKRRGGVGQDISHIRPAGAIAGGSPLGENAGTTLYMERYSQTTREVQQDGRRGALMLSISIDHPDAEAFIDKKMAEGKVTGANVSVKISDDFMRAVNSGHEEYIQSFPVDWFGKIPVELEMPLGKLVEVEKGVYLKKVDPQRIWNKLCHNAWKSAEPGILFWDTVLRESPAAGYGPDWKEVSTNPCFTGDTLVAVADGRHEVSFKDLVDEGGDVPVYSADNEGNLVIRTMRNPRVTGKNSQIYKVLLDNGQAIRCTSNHKFFLKGMQQVEAKNLKTGDSLHIMSKIFELPKRGTTKTTLNSNAQELSEHRFIWEQTNGKIEKGYQIHHINSNPFDNRIENLQCLTITEHNKVHKKEYPGETNGNFGGTTNSELYEKFKQLTLEKGSKLTISEYLNNSGPNFGKGSKYRSVLGESHTHFLQQLADECEELKNHKVVSVTPDGFEDVYNGTVDEFHNYFVGEFEERSQIGRNKLVYCLVANCGEIPLNPYDSCRLIAVNLYSYINDAFGVEAQVDVKKFRKHVRIAMRLMDDLVDLEIEKLDKIISSISKHNQHRVERQLWMKVRDNAIAGRRTGLGILGLGDALAAMGFTYGTPLCTKVAAQFQKLFATIAFESSIELAAERGHFQDWNADKDSKSEFIKRMLDNEQLNPKLKEMYYETGRRNIGLLTIAPTGTASLMTQTTGGIECLFAPWYNRKRKTDNLLKSVKTDEVGDMWEQFAVIHQPFIKWYSVYEELPFILAKEEMQNMSEAELESLFKQSPYFEATSRDVNYIEKVKMQGALQKWVDHSISVTVNMPEETPLQTVKDVYSEAHRSGCKGITVYRDGSRGSILSVSKVEGHAEDFNYISAMKRPKDVKCDVYFRTARGTDYIVFIGIVDDKPYEVFAVDRKSSPYLSKTVKSGTITKEMKGVYSFTSECGKYVFLNIVELMMESEMNETRTISALLRHRVDPAYISKDVIEKFATVNSFHTVLGRVLKLYVASSGEEKCPDCGGKIIETDGCSKCLDCGKSKCS